MRRAAGLMRPMVRRTWLVILLALLWELAARRADSIFIPPMSDILAQFVVDWLPFGQKGVANLTQSAVPTIGRMLGGWLLAAGLGIPVGLVLGRIKVLKLLFRPVLLFGMNVPAPALLPLTIVLFGFGPSGILFLIAFGAIWPILMNTLEASQRLDPMLTQTGRTLHFGPWRFFSRILLPACAPQIATGLRVGLSLALILTVIAEMYGASKGIGVSVVKAQRLFQIAQMWSGIVMLALVGVAANYLFILGERRLLRWHALWRGVNR